jgi:putative zinc finger protein
MDSTVIEHEQAVKDMMAERYLLGELSSQERDAFEAHLFDCSSCFEQVRAGAEFVDYVKRIGAEEQAAVAPRPRWSVFFGQVFRPAPAFAVLFLVAATFSIYQEGRIRHLSAPQAVGVETLHPESRGVKPINAPRHGYFEVRLRFEPQPGVTAYRVRIVNDLGKEVAAIGVDNASNGELQLRLSTDTFAAGRYKILLLTSPSATLVDSYPFELKLQE